MAMGDFWTSINLVQHLGRLLRWAQRSQLCPSESKQGPAWSCPPGSRTSRWWPSTNVFNLLLSNVCFTSTAGFCPNRKASSRSTGPGGLAAAGSSHNKSEATSNLHLGKTRISLFSFPRQTFDAALCHAAAAGRGGARIGRSWGAHA